MVALPADVLEGDIGPAPDAAPDVAPVLASAAALSEVAVLLDGAQAPVIIAGAGAHGCRAELVELAERAATGVYASFRRQDVFPNDHPLYCGHLTLGTSRGDPCGTAGRGHRPGAGVAVERGHHAGLHGARAD